MQNCTVLSLQKFKGEYGMEIKKFGVGDILEMRKQHPCGEKRMKVLRIGSDIRMICVKCGRDITVAREKIEKNIKNVIHCETL